MHIIFSDLKLENCLLDEKGQVKLCDFGIAHVFQGDDDTLTVNTGTLRYKSPEVLTPGSYSGAQCACVYVCIYKCVCEAAPT